MSLMGEYEAWKSKVISVAEKAMGSDVADLAKNELNTMIHKNVYSYGATAQAMAQRRMDGGGLSDKANFKDEVSSSGDSITLTITNEAGVQGSPTGVQLVDFVTQGMKNYKQPYPREFMKPTEELLVGSGKVEALVASAIHAAGL